MSTEPRTVTLATVDAGEITLPEPPWCTGHADQLPGYRADILHRGPDLTLAFRGGEILNAALAQSPYATSSDPEMGGPVVGVSVYPPGRTLTPASVYDLAAALDSYADQLRDLADELATLRPDDAPPVMPDEDPVEGLLGMTRGLIERLAVREDPWDRPVAPGGSAGSSTERTLGGYVVQLRAVISNPTDR
ncbi:DUF6907 domain-containing protein [Streptomyces sp. NPDC003015]